MTLGGPPTSTEVQISTLTKPATDQADPVERLSDISYDLIDDEGFGDEEKLDVFEEIFQLDKKKSAVLEKKTSQLVKSESQQEEEKAADLEEETKDAPEKEDSASFEVVDEVKSNISSDQLSQKQADAGKSDFEEL